MPQIFIDKKIFSTLHANRNEQMRKQIDPHLQEFFRVMMFQYFFGMVKIKYKILL